MSTTTAKPPSEVLVPPETSYKLRKEHQDAIDDAIYKLTIHFSYAYENIVTPLQHFLKYYSFMYPECSNVLQAYENVDFCRERFCYIDYIKWKKAEHGDTSSFSKKEVNDMIRERTVEVQQVNDSMQEQLDRMSQKSTQQSELIEKLESQYQNELKSKQAAEKTSANLQNDMKQLNKELDRLRNEVQMYRDQVQQQQQEEQEQINSTYQQDSSKPSGFSIFKDSLKDDIARIYSSMKESLPKIESSDNEEDDNDEGEEEIYATNLPPATEFESKFGQTLFPRGTFQQPSRSTAGTRPGASTGVATRSAPVTTMVRSSPHMSTGRGNLTAEQLARAEKEMEDAMRNDDEISQDYDVQSNTRSSNKKLSTLVEDISLEAIENDISSKEMEWSAEFEAALQKAQNGDSENPFTTSLDIPSKLGAIDLEGVLKSVQGESESTRGSTPSRTNVESSPKQVEQIRKQAWTEESATEVTNTSASNDDAPAPSSSARDARRRRRMMEIPEHDD